jgi:hypothetical protein
MTKPKLERWLELPLAERDRRQSVDSDALPRFLDQLAEIGRRLRAGPGYIEPTPAEKAQSARQLDQWFRVRDLRAQLFRLELAAVHQMIARGVDAASISVLADLDRAIEAVERLQLPRERC